MNGWADPEPAWWLNLQAHPEATVELPGRVARGDGPRGGGGGACPAVGGAGRPRELGIHGCERGAAISRDGDRRPGASARYDVAMSIRAFYDRWPQYNRRLVDTIAPLTTSSSRSGHRPTIGRSGRSWDTSPAPASIGCAPSRASRGSSRRRGRIRASDGLGGRPVASAERRRARDGARDDVRDHRRPAGSLDAGDA